MGESDLVERFSVDFSGELLLGQFRVLEKIADGGMGAVYLATDDNLGRKVAVKVPHPRFLGEKGFRERFATEVEELIRLEHPHIARILARGEHDHIPFFVLQFLGGGSLEDRIETGPMAPAEVAAWLRTAAETLDFVHGRGIIHRDVKPANILFDEDGNVFLSDFGVAKAMHGEGGGLTATGTGIGSPKHMAPEQGIAQDVGPAADQYGLASAVYEALAGEPPFAGDDPLRMLIRKQKEEPRPLEQVVPTVHPTVSAAVGRALSREPDDRFPTCRDFAEAFASGLSTTAFPTASVPRAATSDGGVTVDVSLTGAKALLVLAAVVGVIVLAVVGVFMLAGNGDPAQTVTEDTDRGTGSRTFVDLVDPGTAPRAELRYRVTAGSRESMRMTWLAEMHLEMDGEATPSAGAIPMVFDSSLEIDALESSGEVRYHWTLEDCRVSVPDDRGEVVESSIERLVGLVAHGRLDARGTQHVLEFPEARAKEPVAQRFLAGISEGLRRLCVPLPEQAVGVGAKWDVTEMLEVGGMRFTGTTRYELLSVEGRRVRVKFSAAMLALGQTVFPPGFEGAAEFEAKTHHATSSGESLIDLTQLVPESSNVRDEMTMEGTHSEEGVVTNLRMRNVVDTVLERR